MTTSWPALRNPVFGRLWIASVISGTCVATHDNAAAYMINTLVASQFDLAHFDRGIIAFLFVHITCRCACR